MIVCRSVVIVILSGLSGEGINCLQLDDGTVTLKVFFLSFSQLIHDRLLSADLLNVPLIFDVIKVLSDEICNSRANL